MIPSIYLVAVDGAAAYCAAKDFWDVTFGHRKQDSSGPEVALAGFNCVLRVITFGVEIEKLRRGKLDGDSLKKLEELIRVSVVTRGLALRLKVSSDYSEGSTIFNFQNTHDLGEILANLALLNSNVNEASTGFRIIQVYILARDNPHPIAQKIRDSVSSSYHKVYNYASGAILDACHHAVTAVHPLEISPLDFDDKDISDLELDTDYDDIPLIYLHSPVFRQFRCPISHRPIRYPVVVLEEHKKDPFQLPMELFERKSLIKLLQNEKTCFYPGTNTEIDLSQVREHLGARTIIEDELSKFQ